MERRLRILGGVLIFAAFAFLIADAAVQLHDGLAGSIADRSNCNAEPCTVDQLRSMGLWVGPITFVILCGFGLVLLKARVTQSPAEEEPGDIGERLSSIDRLREQGGITAQEHAEQRRRILDSV